MLISKEEIKQKLSQPLPGATSHLKMAPPHRADELRKQADVTKHAKKSAVMMLFFQEMNELKMIMIRRSDYVGIHAGQIAFPGGRYEDEDREIQVTAYRELQEEIGITAEKVELLGRLTDIYVPPSNFLISIFVGFLAEKPVYSIDKREVGEVLEIPFADFYKPGVVKFKDFYVNSIKASSNAPYYDVTNAQIWGASAMVITELLDVLNK